MNSFTVVSRISGVKWLSAFASILIIPCRNIMIIGQNCKLLQILSELIMFLTIILIYIQLQRHKMYTSAWTVDGWIWYLNKMTQLHMSLKCDHLPFLPFKLLRYREYMFNCKYCNRVHLPSVWLSCVRACLASTLA